MALWDRICSLTAFVHWFRWVLSPKDRIFHPPYPRLLSLILPTELPPIRALTTNRIHMTYSPWYTWEICKKLVTRDREKKYTLSVYIKVGFLSYVKRISWYAQKPFFDMSHVGHRQTWDLNLNLILYLQYGPVVVKLQRHELLLVIITW